jgi:hypothetical protein
VRDLEQLTTLVLHASAIVRGLARRWHLPHLADSLVSTAPASPESNIALTLAVFTVPISSLHLRSPYSLSVAVNWLF